MVIDREYVLYRNDEGIPPNRKIKVIENEYNSDKSYPKVSIIIPTADGYRNGLLPALLRSISQQNYQDFEIIIIKGDSRQGRAINTGAEIARGTFLLTLDDDTQLISKDVFGKLVRVIENDDSIGMAGGANIIHNSATGFVRRTMKQIPRRQTPKIFEITDSDLAEHGLIIIRKNVFREVGGENELIPRGLDPYLRNQFRKAGYRVVVVPDVYYSHLTPPTFGKLIKQFYRNGKLAAFCSKNYPQWVFETPATHVNDFIEKRSLIYRISRYGVNMFKKMMKGHWIYVSAYTVYAFGFFWGYFCYKDKYIS